MASKVSCSALAITFAICGGAFADTTDVANRFTMSPVEGGFLRLDKQSGAVALCARAAADWSCKPVEDHAAASLSAEIAKLERDNKELKDQVKELEHRLEGSNPAWHDKDPIAEEPPGGKVQLPTEEEVDQALDYLEHMYKKIRDRIKNLEKPLPGDGPKPDNNSL